MTKQDQIFHTESEELFEQIEQTLLNLEKKPGDMKLLDNAANLFHSEKVLITLAGLADLSVLAVLIVEVFEDLKTKKKKAPAEIFTLLFSTQKFIQDIIENIKTDAGKVGAKRPDYQTELHKLIAKWEEPVFISEPRKLTNRRVGQKPKVLIIDDEMVNRTLLEEIVIRTDANIEVVSVDSAEEGLFYYFSDYFNLVFLDIMMPNVDGNHFISIVQKNRDLRHFDYHPNIVVQTAVDSMEQLVSYVRRECIQEIIRKPLSVDRIQECVKRYCHGI